ncbi:hypothetical protein [Roseovarius mucosus]|nr:hypothetical protein [Roseovarius mucosus]
MKHKGPGEIRGLLHGSGPILRRRALRKHRIRCAAPQLPRYHQGDHT